MGGFSYEMYIVHEWRENTGATGGERRYLTSDGRVWRDAWPTGGTGETSGARTASTIRVKS